MTAARTSILAMLVALLLAATGAPLHAQTESSEHSGRTAFSKQDYEGAALYFALAIEEDNEQPTRTKAQRADLFFMRGNSGTRCEARSLLRRIFRCS